MKAFTSISSVLEYLKYLADYSGYIYSQKEISEGDYNCIINEIELFHRRIKEAGFITPILKKELLSINLNPMKKEFSLLSFFGFSYRSWDYPETNAVHQDKRRKNIWELKNHLDNIYTIILLKS